MQDICPKCGSDEVDYMVDEAGNPGYLCLDCMNTWGKGSR